MDGQYYAPPQELPPVEIVSVYPVQEVSMQVADVSRFEPYSIAATLEQMFRDAESPEAQAQEQEYWNSLYQEHEYPSDVKAFRDYMTLVHKKLRGSDAVRDLKAAADNGREITEVMVRDVFTAYDRIVREAADACRGEMTEQQLKKLKGASRANLDWSYRGLLIERLTQPSDAPTRYSLEDFFLILNPKARKVQYMDRPEILKTLEYSMGHSTREQLAVDVRMASKYAHEDKHHEIVTHDDLESYEEQLAA